MKKKLLFAFKLIVSTALVSWLIMRMDWTAVWKEFSEASLFFVLLAFLAYVGGTTISVSRWRKTASFKGFSLSFADGLRYHFAGLFLNNFLPSFFGGDAYRSYLLGKPEKRYAAAASTVLFVRFTGLWATISLFLVFGLVSFSSVLTQPIFVPFAVGLAAFLIVDVLFTVFSDRTWIQKLFSLFPEKLQNFFSEMSGYTDKRFVFESFLVSLLFTFVGVGLFNLTLFTAFHESVPVIPFLSVVFLLSIVSSLPVSINNIGLKEWAYLTFFPTIGISPEAALAVALLGRFLQMFASLFGAPFFFREKKDLQTAEAIKAEEAELEKIENYEEKDTV